MLRMIKEDRSILHTINRKKPNWIGHMLRRNCHLKHSTEGKIEGRIEETGIRKRRRKQLLNETGGYWNLKQKALNRTLWKIRFRKATNLSQEGLRNDANGHGNNNIYNLAY